MAYLAFYRAFRPTTLDEVVRQEHIVTTLKNQIALSKIGHAYLFCGPRGTGKTTIAKIFARAINCEHPVNGSPCGVCPTCKALSDPSNLDISEIDAASNNGVDEMRDLREKVAYPPVAGKYKVYIIDEVHMLTQSAFNAVLKTLEEPPRHVVFILATTEPQKIPATILSRCMRFDFKLLPQADLEGLVSSVLDRVGKPYEKEAVAAIARAGAGSARDSLSIADMCASYSQGKLTYADVNTVLGATDFAELTALLSAVLLQNAPEALSLVEKSLSTGKGVGVLVRDLVTLLNQVTIAKMCKNAKDIIALPAERFDAVLNLANGADGHKLLRVTELLTKAEADLRYSLNGRITLETAILKCAMPDTDYNLDALLGRVNALEQQLAEIKANGITVRRESAIGNSSAPVAENIQPPVSEKKAKAVMPDAKPLEKGNDEAPKKKVPQKTYETLSPVLEEERESSPFEGEQSASRVAPAKEEQTSQSAQPTMWEAHDNLAGVNGGTVGSLSEEDKKTVYGRFMRLLRTTRRNAILLTLCSDLESSFEGNKLILTTASDPICRALFREENQKFLADTLSMLGVFEFEVRLRSKGTDNYQKDVEQLKKNFGDNFKIK